MYTGHTHQIDVHIYTSKLRDRFQLNLWIKLYKEFVSQGHLITVLALPDCLVCLQKLYCQRNCLNQSIEYGEKRLND